MTPEEISRCSYEFPLLAFVYRFRPASEIGPVSIPDLDKNDGGPVAHDKIDFSPSAAVVLFEEYQAFLLKKTEREILRPRATRGRHADIDRRHGALGCLPVVSSSGTPSLNSAQRSRRWIRRSPFITSRPVSPGTSTKGCLSSCSRYGTRR